MPHRSTTSWPSISIEQWNIDKGYKGSDMFRPAGTTPGHWLEWARLLAQLWVLDGRREPG